LGVGVINFAYLLAKHKLKWDSPEAYQLTHETFERFQYYLLKASCELAKEFGVSGYDLVGLFLVAGW
jgi:ribonucleoside-diphosphate reductase alpha chain